jgi:hypothetical protein
MTKQTGGPAFPVSHDMALVAGLQNAYGMTLRDYFAAKAMQGFTHEYVYDNSDVIADKAYTLADAMLKAREQ